MNLSRISEMLVSRRASREVDSRSAVSYSSLEFGNQPRACSIGRVSLSESRISMAPFAISTGRQPRSDFGEGVLSPKGRAGMLPEHPQKIFGPRRPYQKCGGSIPTSFLGDTVVSPGSQPRRADLRGTLTFLSCLTVSSRKSRSPGAVLSLRLRFLLAPAENRLLVSFGSSSRLHLLFEAGGDGATSQAATFLSPGLFEEIPAPTAWFGAPPPKDSFPSIWSSQIIRWDLASPSSGDAALWPFCDADLVNTMVFCVASD